MGLLEHFIPIYSDLVIIFSPRTGVYKFGKVGKTFILYIWIKNRKTAYMGISWKNNHILGIHVRTTIN